MTFQEFLEERDEEVRSYSGRGMYGKQCVGLVVPKDDESPLAVLQEIAYELGRESSDSETPALPRDVRMDSLGLDTILYWPSEKWPEEPHHADD